ncbi:MAG: MFS transporter [Candidatus Heimdallarchaeota archaeon]|nr:MFS transporter [Candidatus Heimdallarchaeota archaeon]
MLQKEHFRLLMPLNLFHTMAHIYPYFLPILCQIIREDVDFLSYTQIGIISMTIVLVTIPLTIIIGFAGDIIRKWRFELIAFGFILIVSHTFIIYAANSFAVLLIAGVIVGIGSSVFHPIALPLLSQEFGANRNLAHSVNLIFGNVGSIVTPITTLGLSNWLGWRTATLIFGIFGLICIPILITFLLLSKKHLHFIPQKTAVIGERVYTTELKEKNKSKIKHLLGFITLPFIAIVIAQVFRTGIFRLINTFTSFIFEDRFGFSKMNSALIMSLVLAAGGIAALISGFVSTKAGSLKTFLWSKVATTATAVGVVIFTGALTLTNASTTAGLGAVAILLFVFLAASYYFGNPSSNSILAEVIPLEILSSVFGVISAFTTAFAATIPVIFGAIVDQGYSLPYEYLLLIILSLIPLLLLLYVKKKLGFKTPQQIEEERAQKNKELNSKIDDSTKMS